MKTVIRIYSLILLLYTGWRTYDFISSQLPKTDISFWLSIAFLFATEAGLVLWHEAHLRHVTTATQEQVTLAMTWIDFVGSLAAGIADMILRQTLIGGYEVPGMLAQFLIFGLPLIMAANVGAVIIYEEHDAETQEDRAEKQLAFEIHRQAMIELKKDRSAIAEEKKAAIYQKMRGSVTGRLSARYSGQPELKPAPAKRTTILPLTFRRHEPYQKDAAINGKTDVLLSGNDEANPTQGQHLEA